MEKASGLAQKVFLNGLTVPALNKCTTVAPCLGQVTAMQQLCVGHFSIYGLSLQGGAVAKRGCMKKWIEVVRLVRECGMGCC